MSGKPQPTSQRAIAEKLSKELGRNITIRCVQLWKAKGLDLDDTEGLQRHLNNQVRQPRKIRQSSPVEIPPPDASEPSSSEDLKRPMTPDELDLKLVELQDRLMASTDWDEARTIRTQIVGLRDLLKVQTERGVLMQTADARTAALTAATASRAAWEKIEDELPPMLEGLTAAQMKQKLRDFARMKCTELAGLFE